MRDRCKATQMIDRGYIVARVSKIGGDKATQMNSTAKIVAEVLEIRQLRVRKGNINAGKRRKCCRRQRGLERILK